MEAKNKKIQSNVNLLDKSISCFLRFHHKTKAVETRYIFNVSSLIYPPWDLFEPRIIFH